MKKLLQGDEEEGENKLIRNVEILAHPSPPTTESTSTSPPTEAKDVIQLGDWQGPDSD